VQLPAGLDGDGPPSGDCAPCASSFRGLVQNSSDFHVFALSLRMGQGQLVSHFRRRLERRMRPEAHWEDF
jgi:hypothetical protein